ncbi:MAG: 4-hydroxy-tetrahydrodipicolinate reductase [Rhodospirillaceae bacterium]|jgi:4-hydroxy-tetrahydrodipicolinate reductase|nr:4-hydroxy-tetrahydrodipicolinate reductase [Rhodospirillaceae bacterium]|tara:strand:- start:1287 stop:2087 length:801 start_codon:yes stop_codon:yes gene_type:complete
MKIGIVGAAGRMGRMLIAEVLGTGGCQLAGGTEQPGSDAIGQDLGVLIGADEQGLSIGDDARALFEASDAVVDFTQPEATMGHAALSGETGVALIVGTTGLEAPHMEALGRAAAKAAVVQAANMSVGVNLLLGLTEQVANALGEDYDIEIAEMHHRHKVDAPSGTALALGAAAAKGRGVDLNEVSDRGRDGETGPRKAGDIGFSVIRGGDVAGDHWVVFAGPGERVELTHKAGSREIFARGALRAALWTEGRAPGLYSMRDVLGLD